MGTCRSISAHGSPCWAVTLNRFPLFTFNIWFTIYYLFYVFYMNGRFFCMYVPWACLVPYVKKGHWILWYGSCRWLSVILSILGVKFRSSVRETSSVNHWATSPATLPFQVYFMLWCWVMWLPYAHLWQVLYLFLYLQPAKTIKNKIN